MIKDHCFTEEWLDLFKKQKAHRRIDKVILEKMIYALHLLEQLKLNKLDFVFKGGTSLLLLLDEGNRFSIDIDIICKFGREELEQTLSRIIESSRFTKWQLDEHRSYESGVPKAHYKFIFEANNQFSGTILLDILIEDSIYPEITEKPVASNWVETNENTMIVVPTIDSITGDKLTAFAPNTTGIPYFKGKDKQSFSMEICKQLFDLGKLFEKIDNMEIVAKSFEAFAKKEIEYRKDSKSDITLTPENVLHDTIATSVILAKRGRGSDDEKASFSELQKGITAFASGFLMTGNFRIDEAISASARVAYLAAKILMKDLSPIIFYEGQDNQDLTIKQPDWNFLNPLKRQSDKSSFYYWYQAIQLLTGEKP